MKNVFAFGFALALVFGAAQYVGATYDWNPIPSVSVFADPLVIFIGESSDLSLELTNGNLLKDCKINGVDGTSLNVSPLVTTEYKGKCKGKWTGIWYEDTVTVTVVKDACPLKEGNQLEDEDCACPEGQVPNEAGDACVPKEVPPTDVCPLQDGDQATGPCEVIACLAPQVLTSLVVDGDAPSCECPVDYEPSDDGETCVLIPEEPPVTPEQPRGGGGACMNCGDDDDDDDSDPVDEPSLGGEEEEEEEEPTFPWAPSCPALIKSYIKLGASNNFADVVILQNFLNNHMGKKLPLTGFYDVATYNAVKEFQAKYYASVIAPWHTYLPGMGVTGYVYQTTRFAVNKILCAPEAGSFPTLIP